MSPSEVRPWFLRHFERTNQNSENEASICQRCSQFLQIHYIRCTDKVAGFLVTIIGLLTSLWANCILIVICTQDYDKYLNKGLFVEKTIVQTSQLSHFLLVITATVGLLYGIKVKNKAYFSPWIFIKILELCVLILGIILLVTAESRRFIGIVPFGVSFFLIGLYITLCVWNTYKYVDIGEPHDNLEEILVGSNNQLRDPPPSYESYTVQSLPDTGGGQRR